jgi:hypothetical protein
VNTAEIVAAFAGQDAVSIVALAIFGKLAFRTVDRWRLMKADTPPASQAAQTAPIELPARRAS